MDYYAGIDVSLEESSVCVVDSDGRIVREAKVLSEPEALIAWFCALGLGLSRIGLEAGPLSQWLYAAMKQAGLAVELLETRHVRDAFKAMPVKTDRKDARGIAQLMRLGWFRPVHCKSMSAQEVRALLTARKLRPINLWISWVRPDCLPFAASRSVRLWVDRGSMPYSAVTHPLPLLRRNGGTFSSTEAVHRTWVSPKRTMQEPAAYLLNPGSSETGRS